MTTIPVRVADVVDEADGIRSLRLVRPDGLPFGPHRAGAHVDVVGPTGVLRQYSLCGPPDDAASLLIAVKRERSSRGGSAALHEVAPGDELHIGAPRNLLGVDPDADRHVLVAGGIGVTPLLGMAHALHRAGADFTLHYFARSRSEAAFADLLETGFAGRVRLHLGVPRSEHAAVLGPVAAGLGPGAAVYTCGPEGFMDGVRAVFAPVVGDDRVHVERFTAIEVDTTGDTAFTVALDTGEEFEVPADRSILEVLTDNGIEVFRSCEEGVCGSCVSGVVEGVPEHRDSCLSAADRAAGDQIALCVSRARTPRLVVELY
ncbi:PDR/VanB family oxidoreductase [Pseudonocardia alni]|jgi:ferredoxin-NADP reductase|uniref:PDR/VanB family oxidoreductase n=1 Tax=Pseudonocardia alni TaxID=33907 RepID=UPI00280ADC9B|nr:PDR/VanB family oxidoreductase [Pseudonocardia alni]